MIPWITITIPLDLYYSSSNHIPPTWLQSILELPLVNWTYGVIIILTFEIFLIGGSLIWIGWQILHPITERNHPISNIDRLNLIQSFSKDQFLENLHEEAHDFKKKRFK